MTSSADDITWRDVPRPFRVFARWVTIAQAAGYGVSLAIVPRMPRSPDMLPGAHAHLLGMTALLAFTAVWSAKELDHRFVWLLPVTGVVMTAAFYAQTIRILRELRAAARA